MQDIKALTFTGDDGEQVNAHDFLMRHGNLDVPGGRYGTTTVECAEIALLLWLVLLDANGSDCDNEHSLEGCMSSVVNSADDVCWSILDSRHVFNRNDNDAPLWCVSGIGGTYPIEIRDLFDDDEIEYSRELYAEAYGEPPRGW